MVVSSVGTAEPSETVSRFLKDLRRSLDKLRGIDGVEVIVAIPCSDEDDPLPAVVDTASPVGHPSG